LVARGKAENAFRVSNLNMKTLLFMLLLSITITTVYAGVSDTGKTNQDTTQHKSSDPKKNKSADAGTNTKTIAAWSGKEVEGADWVLVWAPVAFFIIGIWAINSRTKDFKLQDALTEDNYPLITIPNPLYTPTVITALPVGAPPVPPTITVNKTDAGFPKSSSRYLALITTALTLIIAACLTSAFIYIYISSGSQPEFNHLGDILLALGIGVTPYAFNKVSTAISSKQ
jgi:hypothetical protein